MIVELLNTPQLVKLSSNDEPMEEYLKEESREDLDENSKEDPEEDPKLGEPQANDGIGDMKSGVFDSSFDYGKELLDEFDPNYDPLQDH